MYEVLEHWKEYQRKKRELENQSKELFNECGFQYKKEGYKQMDKFLNKIITKNGITKY